MFSDVCEEPEIRDRFLLYANAMRDRRHRSIGTKVTDVEYRAIVRLAEPLTISEWVRNVLVSASHPDPLHFLLLAEFMALRTILINLDYAIASGGAPTVDEMRKIIASADADKFNLANDRLPAQRSSPVSTRR